jgi:hypothetical protein
MGFVPTKEDIVLASLAFVSPFGKPSIALDKIGFNMSALEGGVKRVDAGTANACCLLRYEIKKINKC